MDTRQPLDGRAMGLMSMLCILWGLQQVVLKLSAQDIAPMLLIALRSGGAAVLVMLLMIYRRESLRFARNTWLPGAAVGVLFAVEYLLVAQGLLLSTAGHIVVFLYTSPIFAALGLHWKLPSERLAPVQWLGIGLAFGGIALAFMGHGATGYDAGACRMLLGDMLGLLAGASWGATTVVLRCSPLARVTAAQTLLYQLVGAFVLLLPASLLLGQSWFHFTAMAWGSLAFQTLIVSFASFLVWFWLLRHYLASRLGVFSFMTPLFGVIFGTLLLGEPVELSFLSGFALVLLGIVLVSAHSWLQPLWRRKRMMT